MKENREPVHRARVQTFEIEYVRALTPRSLRSSRRQLQFMGKLISVKVR